jgi:hypothetical protein
VTTCGAARPACPSPGHRQRLGHRPAFSGSTATRSSCASSSSSTPLYPRGCSCTSPSSWTGGGMHDPSGQSLPSFNLDPEERRGLGPGDLKQRLERRWLHRKLKSTLQIVDSSASPTTRSSPTSWPEHLVSPPSSPKPSGPSALSMRPTSAASSTPSPCSTTTPGRWPGPTGVWPQNPSGMSLRLARHAACENQNPLPDRRMRRPSERQQPSSG